MKTVILTNSTGSKKVNIVPLQGYGHTGFTAFYIQVYKGEEQVLDTKDYKSFKMAEKWGLKQLNN